MFGGVRRWKGEAGDDCVDTWPFSVEIKHGKQVPKKLEKYMEQAEHSRNLFCALDGHISPDDIMPVVVMHPHGANIMDSYVMMRLKNFREWYLDG